MEQGSIDVMAEVRMIVGLGNPGGEYARTRHNIGFRVMDALAEALDTEVKARKFGARFGRAKFAGKKLILLKPWRFMNCSGAVVATALGFYRLGLSDLLIVSDDMSLPVGGIRLRSSGSAGGHNGLADIIEELGDEEFARCRVGVGGCGGIDAAEYVLAEPGEAEKPLLVEAIERAKDAVFCWVGRGIEAAMNEFNG